MCISKEISPEETKAENRMRRSLPCGPVQWLEAVADRVLSFLVAQFEKKTHPFK